VPQASARPIQLIARWTRRPIVCGKASRIARCLAFSSAWVRPVFVVIRFVPVALWQGAKIAPAVIFDQRAQPLGRDNLNRIAPLIEMPCHLKPARRMKAHDESTILLHLNGLLWVKAEFGRPCRSVRRK